jgi:adenosylcobinamide-GDP ribazoletransferase
MAIGMYSILPVPKRSWDERCLPWVIPWIPVVGALIGTVWYAVAYVTVEWPLPMRTAAVLLTPFILSGFLHLDGYMDTADALFSRRSLEEKKRILKDSHVGAFAVIALVSLFLLQFCAVETILTEKKPLTAFLFVPVCSRCTTGIMLLRLPATTETGLAAMFKKNIGKRHWAFLLGLSTITVTAAWFDMNVLLASFVVFVTTIGVLLYLAADFRGVSGDLCGCAVTLSELCGLLCLSLI